MKSKIVWLILSCLMVVALVLASCAPTEEEEEEEEVTPPTEEEEEEEEEVIPPTGNWWDKFGEPEYGGTLTFAPARFSMQLSTDPGSGTTRDYGAHMYFCETLFSWDWTLDREVFSFPGPWGPEEVNVGRLLESWEQPDAGTVILHIRQGILWQDKPPMNGREFTAYDIQYHYDRLLGTGSGFTAPSAMYSSRQANWEKCVATDKYTATFTFKEPSAVGLLSIMEQTSECNIEPPEVIEQYGNMDDWKNAVGTGPWILTDYVASSSLTFVKNPNYWGYDERHPENKIPYADTLRLVCIPDIATRMSAMRSGKADLTDELNWEQAESLTRTNPEMQKNNLPYMTDGVSVRADIEPFNDIRVRKALEMAIDRETIKETHYGGTVEGIPCGWVTRELRDYIFPYEDWPQELKDEYSYNPTRAMELLEEAGHPDGIKTSILAASNTDLDLLQIIVAEFKDIGVDAEIRVMEPTAAMAAQRAGDWEMNWGRNTGSTAMPHNVLIMYSTSYQTPVIYSDPTFDAMAATMMTTPDPDEATRMCVEMDKYMLENHWGIRIFTKDIWNVWQPWLKGYSGENLLRTGSPGGWPWARWWIDHDLKESMGY